MDASFKTLLSQKLQSESLRFAQEELIAFENAAEKYPYSQIIQFLLCRAKHHVNKGPSVEELNSLSLRTFDRTLLYDEFSKVAEQPESEDEESSFEEPLILRPKEGFSFSFQGENFSFLPEGEDAVAIVEDDKGNRMAHGAYDIEQEYTADAEDNHPKKRQIDIIDSFLKNQKDRKPRERGVKTENLHDESLEETEELVSETLAKIFEKQENYMKAINVYQKLSLREPEKKQKFARLIEELKKKIQ